MMFSPRMDHLMKLVATAWEQSSAQRGRTVDPKVQEAAAERLALQRDEYRSDPTSASLLVVKEQVFSSNPGADQEVQEGVDTKAIPELAAWTSLCRVLFNLNEFAYPD